MKALSFDSIQLGDSLEELVEGPITQDTLRSYAVGSGDYNPLHLDPDFARLTGMPNAFAHGMLSMAYLAKLLTNWVDQHRIRQMRVRFIAITHLEDVIYCNARVTDKYLRNGEQCVALRLTTRNQDGQCKLRGEAVVVLS
jgi:acyl dehydratase